MQNFIPECKRRYRLFRLQRRINRLTRALLRQSSARLDTIPMQDLRYLSRLRTETQIRQFERERGLV